MGIIVTLALAVAASPARADQKPRPASRAMTIARDVLPVQLDWIGGIDLAAPAARAIAKRVWETYGPSLVPDGPTLVKQACGRDLPALIDSMVVAGDSKDGDDRGVVIVALAGLDRKAFDACVTKLGDRVKHPITIEAEGELTRYRADDTTQTVRWLGPDVFAVTDAGDEAQLAAMTAGTFERDDKMRGVLPELDLTAALWIATTKPSDPALIGEHMMRAWGSLVIAKGSFRASGVLDLGGDPQSTRAVERLKAGVAKTTAEVPALAKVFAKLVIKKNGRAVLLDLTITDTQLRAFLDAVKGHPLP